MNDKDKDLESFKKWIENDTLQPMEVNCYRAMTEDLRVMFSMERAWQAAIEYQQKEIEEDEDRLRNHMNSIGYRELKKLQDQNKKLCKALELCKQEATRPAYVITICKEALKEAGEE
jgi:hypothetical protein